jgi:hypothetical protein
MGLTKDEFDKARDVGMRKLVNKNIQLYNVLCNKCKLKSVQITKRGNRVRINDYCDECQIKAKEKLEGFL